MQFRIEFIQDTASGQYCAELYSPENAAELLARTESIYPDQPAALLGVIELLKGALAVSQPPSAGPRSRPTGSPRRARPARKASPAKARKRPKRRSAPRRSSSAPKGRTSRRAARRRSR